MAALHVTTFRDRLATPSTLLLRLSTTRPTTQLIGTQRAMKVLRINDGALTDFEVFELVQERKASRLQKNASVAYAERNWMDHKVLKFLGQHHSKCRFLDLPKIHEFIERIHRAGFQLTSEEKMQFINHCPTELIDIHLIVEDCAGRFSEQEIDEMLQIVQETLALDLLKAQEEAEQQQQQLEQDERSTEDQPAEGDDDNHHHHQ